MPSYIFILSEWNEILPANIILYAAKNYSQEDIQNVDFFVTIAILEEIISQKQKIIHISENSNW